jgi:hypothetical protein
VQNQIAEYLRSISCDVDVMTDVRVSIKVVTVSVIYRTRFKNLAYIALLNCNGLLDTPNRWNWFIKPWFGSRNSFNISKNV